MEDKDKIAAIGLKAEASYQDTLPERLTELVSINDELAEIVASNVSAPPELLKELASRDNKAVKKAVVSNPNTPIKTLFKLAEYYPQEFLANPILDILFVENPNFLKGMYISYEALSVLVQQPHLPKYILQYLANNEYGYSFGRIDIAESAKLHVDYAGEMNEGWHEAAMQRVRINDDFYYPHQEKGQNFDMFYHYYYCSFLWNFKDFLPSRLFVLAPFKIYGQVLDDYPDTLAELIEKDDFEVKIAIAEITKTIGILEELATYGDEEENVKQEVARNANTPIHILEALAIDEEKYVRLPVATNKNTPIHILEALAIDEEKYIRLAVATNKNTPIHILEALAIDEDSNIRVAVATNTNTPTQILETLAIDEDSNIRVAVATNKNTPIHILEKLAIDADENVRVAVAKNTNIPIHILEKLAINTYSRIREAVAENTNTPIHILEKLVNDKEICVVLEVVRNSNTQKKIIERIYRNTKDKFLGFLIAVADNPNTPQKILTKLSNSKYDDVKQAVANNKNTLLSTLEKLAKDKNIYTLLTILEREQCSSEINQKIFNNLKKIDFDKKIDNIDKYKLDDEIDAHLELAYHEKCPIEVKEKIFSSLTKASESYFIAFIVFMSDYAKVEDLVTYSKSKLWIERYAISQNKKTPKETLEILAKDCNRIVRATAKESLEKLQCK